MASTEVNVQEKKQTINKEYVVEGFKEDDHISIESETNEFVSREPPDGGRAWLVLFGCFCVSLV
jgi:hypothetical protein